MKTIQPRHRMTMITATTEIASAQRNGLHDIKASQAPDGSWWAASASVEKFRKMLKDGRSDAYIEFGFDEPLGANEEGK